MNAHTPQTRRHLAGAIDYLRRAMRQPGIYDRCVQQANVELAHANNAFSRSLIASGPMAGSLPRPAKGGGQ